MRTKNKLLFIFLSGLLITGVTFAQVPVGAGETVTFRFVPGNDMFYIPWGGNGAELNRLYSLVDKHRIEIAAGRIPIHVDGYCASTVGETHEALSLAAVRSNRVKSELITHEALLEEHFITRNHATAYTAPDGQAYRNMVVVTLHIPVPPEPEPAPEETHPQPTVTTEPEPQTQPVANPGPAHTHAIGIPQPENPYLLALRTNLLYDAFLLPTLGIEWRVNQDIGIKLDGSRSWWGDGHGKVQKVWLVSPEVRWYLADKKRLYVGAAANFGEYNIYKYMAGNIVSDDTGYQGKLWGAGLTVGYQLYLSRSFSIDFNLGLGYTRFEYDTFAMQDTKRVYKGRDCTKNFWGPTQAGISLIWTIGRNK